jgi:DNA invertase Pin-like site-specific DNA recombinase
MKLQAFGYVRVSSRGQLDKDGPVRQAENIRNFAKGKFTIEQIYTDDVTGISDESYRPEFQDMMAEILRNGVKTVIVEGMDRLARSYAIQETLLIYLVSKGVTLFSARTGENITEAIAGDPMKKALIQMQGIFSELERAMLVSRMKTARDRIRKKTGKCEGRHGYSEPTSADIVKHIREFSKIRRTSIWIAEWLNNNNFKPLHSDRFTSQIIRNVKHRLKIA